MYNRVYGPYKQEDTYRIELRQDKDVVKVFTRKDLNDAEALVECYRESLRAQKKKKTPTKKAPTSKSEPYMDIKAWLALLWKRNLEAESRADAEVIRSLASSIREARAVIMLSDPAGMASAAVSGKFPAGEDLRNMPQEELEELARQHLSVVK